MILPADKGRAVVVLDKSEYKSKAQELLSDSKTYKKLKRDPTNTYCNKLINVIKPLKESGDLPIDIYRKIYPTSTELPKFYGLPKIHKPSVPLRPIVASRGSITYGVARYIADILSPLVGKTPRHLNNSTDLVNKLKDIRLEPDESLVSFDVSALFTSVPVEESLEIIREKLASDPTLGDHTSLSADQVTDILRVCLTTTYFRYEGEYYVQVEGAAMGSPVSPIVANLFMEHFEEKALTTYPQPPRIWVRYVDDTGTIIKTSHIDSFTAHLNQVHPNIKFTSEVEHNGELPILDVLICRKDDGCLKFKVYRKNTHTDHYLQFDSHQPLEHKLGVIRTLTHRAKSVVSEEEDLSDELDHLRTVLSVSGYTKWSWQAPSSNKRKPQPSREKKQKPKGHVTLPYIQGVTEALCRKIRKAGVAAHTRPHDTLRRRLVRPKDSEEAQKKCGVVYHLSCAQCDSQYIGETERSLHKRLQEHRRESSPVGHHMIEKTHKLDDQNIKVIDRESRWFERGVREAIHIRAQSPSLNRDQGRHQLPPVYNSLIRSCDVSRSTPATLHGQTDHHC